MNHQVQASHFTIDETDFKYKTYLLILLSQIRVENVLELAAGIVISTITYCYGFNCAPPTPPQHPDLYVWHLIVTICGGRNFKEVIKLNEATI